ncbi:hypothetical protein AHAS_Ahas13G0155000 [Arachis hypogaea]
MNSSLYTPEKKSQEYAEKLICERRWFQLSQLLAKSLTLSMKNYTKSVLTAVNMGTEWSIITRGQLELPLKLSLG